MKKKNKEIVFATFHPSDGNKNSVITPEKLTNMELTVIHTQYRDKDNQGHNTKKDLENWLEVVSVLHKRGKIKDKKILRELEDRIKPPSFLARLFRKSS